MSRIVLIDGDSILQKAFYSVPMMTDTADSTPMRSMGFEPSVSDYNRKKCIRKTRISECGI